MKNRFLLVVLFIVIVSLLMVGCSQFLEKVGVVPPNSEQELVGDKAPPGQGLARVIIGFTKPPQAAEEALIKGVGGKIKTTYRMIPAIAAQVPEQAIEALKKNPNVTQIEMDTRMYAYEESSNWGIAAIGADIAHLNNFLGEGIEVAIIDTGIDYTHAELSSSYAGGYDFVNLDNDPADDNGHGTHVAGIIAADNQAIGVAPNTALYALKVLDSEGLGYVSDIISALQWASDPNGNGKAEDRLDIVNMSFGAEVGNIFLRWACRLAERDGLLLVAAAGNGGTVGYPAAYDTVIAVSATNSSDELAYFSSIGPEVELAAPGMDIYSTIPGNSYDSWSGTSMACPHVVGAAVLVWAANPGWSNDQVRSQLTSTAEDIGLTSYEQGYGLVNVAAALGLDEEPIYIPVTGVTLVPESITLQVGESATLTATISPDNATNQNVSWSSSNTGVASVNMNGSVMAVGVGTATITVTTEDSGYTDTCQVTVESAIVPGELSIDTFELTDTSNPAWTRVSVDWAVSGTNLASVKTEMIIDEKLVDTQTSNISGSTATGVHELRVKNKKGEIYVKLTVTDEYGTVDQTKTLP